MKIFLEEYSGVILYSVLGIMLVASSIAILLTTY